MIEWRQIYTYTCFDDVDDDERKIKIVWRPFVAYTHTHTHTHIETTLVMYIFLVNFSLVRYEMFQDGYL